MDAKSISMSQNYNAVDTLQVNLTTARLSDLLQYMSVMKSCTTDC